MKPFKKITISDIEESPVWKFSNNGKNVEPVTVLPVENLTNCLVGTKVELSSGAFHWAILLNLSLDEPEYNVHLITLRLQHNGQWFELGRYFDADYEDKDAEVLAKSLNLSVSDIFPIAYDLSDLAIGSDRALKGQIPSEVTDQLPLSELMKFIVKKHSPK